MQSTIFIIGKVYLQTGLKENYSIPLHDDPNDHSDVLLIT
jgi:hypothetical protein